MVDHDEAGWEYLLLADELEMGLREHRTARLDFNLGISPPGGMRIADNDAIADVELRIAQIMHIVSNNFEAIMNPAVLEAALGAPGEEGDEEGIRHFARSIGCLYRSLIDWAAGVRGALVGERFKSLYWYLSNYASMPIAGYEQWAESLIDAVRSYFGPDAAADPHHADLTFVLKLDIAESDQAKVLRELDRLRRDTGQEG